MSAKIYICSHVDFFAPVRSKVYEVVNMKKKDIAPNGLRGGFYSELLGYKRVVDRKRLPRVIGFCGYRKYFDFLDNVDDLEKWVEEYGCVTIKPIVFPGGTLRDQYASCLNVEDLDIITRVIDEHMPDFAPAFRKSIAGNSLHPCNMFVMASADAREMVNAVWNLLDLYLEKVGLDIDQRIRDNQAQYMHLEASAMHDYQYRIGGHLGERIVSAWIDWKFPNAMTRRMVTTSDAR